MPFVASQCATHNCVCMCVSVSVFVCVCVLAFVHLGPKGFCDWHGHFYMNRIGSILVSIQSLSLSVELWFLLCLGFPFTLFSSDHCVKISLIYI